MAIGQGNYAVLWPRGKKVKQATHLARRLDGLQGKTIGGLWNWVYRGDQIFPMLERNLTVRFPGIKFVNYEVFGPTHGSEEARTLADLPDKLRQNKCDAIISSMGC